MLGKLHRLEECALQSQKMFQWLTLALYMLPMQHWGNCVPSLATMKASKDARRPQGYPAGAAAAPARAARRRTPSAWLRPAARAQQGEGLHSAAVGRVRRRGVLRAPVPRGRRLRRTRSLRLRHGAGSTRGTCTNVQCWCRFH